MRLIAGSLALRDHIERQFGFEQVMAHEFPNLKILPVRESRDDWRKLDEMTAQLKSYYRPPKLRSMLAGRSAIADNTSPARFKDH